MKITRTTRQDDTTEINTLDIEASELIRLQEYRRVKEFGESHNDKVKRKIAELAMPNAQELIDTCGGEDEE